MEQVLLPVVRVQLGCTQMRQYQVGCGSSRSVLAGPRSVQRQEIDETEEHEEEEHDGPR